MRSSWVKELAQFELVITLQGCTTLPTRREDHATHPTGQSWIRGYSRQPFPTRLNRWGYAQLARGDLVPLRTSLNFPTHSSTRGPAKPPYIARWPRIWDRAPMIKSKKVFGLSVPLYWICGSTEKCSKPTSSTRSLIDPSGLCPCDFIL